MKKLVLIGCLLSFPALSQQQPTQEYTIKLTAQDLDVIGAGLGDQPFNKAAPLINKLRQQVMEQQQAKEAPKVETGGTDPSKLPKVENVK